MDKCLVLDACCGSKMFWFDNENPLTVFSDIRSLDTNLCDGRSLKVEPDLINDFRNLSFKDKHFKLVSFDPPHLKIAGDNGWQALKYGKLNETWVNDLALGFSECFRVLVDDGILIFKWNETQIKTSEILKLSEYKPMFGHISGKRSDTHWICFMKNSSMLKDDIYMAKNRTAQASILCQNKGFQVWLNDQIKFKTGVRVTCKDQARESVRIWCEVDSLSQLNQELEPVNRFNRLVALFEYEVK